MTSQIEPLHLVALMNQAPRCGARTRRGTPCCQPAVKGKRRCRMHGGAAGSGGQPGNRNARKHGRYTAQAMAWRRLLCALLEPEPSRQA